jgi:hypothetical protein
LAPESVAVPTCTPSEYSFTTSPATAAEAPVPVRLTRIVGVLSLVLSSVDRSPESLPATRSTTGVPGGVVSGLLFVTA